MKWYQFHLSTTVAVTLLAGALLGLNLTPQQPPDLPITQRNSFEVVGHSYGWPSAWDEARVERKFPPDMPESQRMTLLMA